METLWEATFKKSGTWDETLSFSLWLNLETIKNLTVRLLSWGGWREVYPLSSQIVAYKQPSGFLLPVPHQDKPLTHAKPRPTSMEVASACLLCACVFFFLCVCLVIPHQAPPTRYTLYLKMDGSIYIIYCKYVLYIQCIYTIIHIIHVDIRIIFTSNTQLQLASIYN